MPFPASLSLVVFYHISLGAIIRGSTAAPPPPPPSFARRFILWFDECSNPHCTTPNFPQAFWYWEVAVIQQFFAKKKCYAWELQTNWGSGALLSSQLCFCSLFSHLIYWQIINKNISLHETLPRPLLGSFIFSPPVSIWANYVCKLWLLWGQITTWRTWFVITCHVSFITRAITAAQLCFWSHLLSGATH